MKRLWSGGLLAALTGVLLALPHPASACSCVALEPADYLRQADAVFSGTVRQVNVVQLGGALVGRVYYATTNVNRVYKGNVGHTVVVETGESGGLCGFPFAVGTTYLIYAKGSGDIFSTNLCAGTLALAEATGRIASLGAGTPVQPPVVPPTPRPRHNPTVTLALGLKAAGVFGALAVLVHLLTIEHAKRKTP